LGELASEGGANVGFLRHAEGSADAVQGEATDAMGEQPSASLQEGIGAVVGAKVVELGDDGPGDGVRGSADRAQQGQHLVGFEACGETVGGELEQRGARDAPAFGAASFNRSGGLELVETGGHQRG
jgi:hypothetical protein